MKFDLILSAGVVLDPANGFEGIADVGIKSGKIVSVAPELDPHDAEDLMDVSGLWIMPGQIDTHAHVAGIARNWDPALGYGMLARAGTTTVLDMGGTGPSLIDGIKRKGAGLNVAGLFAMIPGATISSADPTKSMLRDIVSEAKKQGCIGIKILGGYHPFTPETTAEIISTCNDQRAYIAIHVGTRESGSHLGGLREIPQLVGKGRLHVCHVNSYCRGVIEDPIDECNEALEILDRMRDQLNSEVYHAIANGTSGRCDNKGNVMADVPRNCLRLRDYPTTRDGIRQAIRDGYGRVVAQVGGQVMYVGGDEALKLFDESNSNVGMTFPVNLPASAFRLTTAKNASGQFIADAVSTDGGSHPRNVAIQSSMALVQFGAMTPLEMVTKLSWVPSRMLGLTNKGHFSQGADADITVINPATSEPTMTMVAGKPIMLDGVVVGSGGTLLITPEGEATVANAGVAYEVLDLTESKLYANY